MLKDDHFLRKLLTFSNTIAKLTLSPSTSVQVSHIYCKMCAWFLWFGHVSTSLEDLPWKCYKLNFTLFFLSRSCLCVYTYIVNKSMTSFVSLQVFFNDAHTLTNRKSLFATDTWQCKASLQQTHGSVTGAHNVSGHRDLIPRKRQMF